MPARTTNDSGAPAPAGKRFELPSLDLKFGSLTDGTDIPPPLPSPVREGPPPKTPTPEDVPMENAANGGAKVHANGTEASESKGIEVAKGPVEDGPASPTLSSRGSLRRLLSRGLLNNAYEEQGSIDAQTVSRPPSRTASTIADEKRSKRGSGWFRRLRSNETPSAHKTVHAEVKQVKQPMGPPPPMIPEMSTWESKVDTKMDEDLFKEIK